MNKVREDKMKKLVTMLSLLILLSSTSSYAEEYEEIPYMYKCRATAYCLDGHTCTGKDVREGICAAGNKDWVGKTVILYQRLPNGKVGEMIGIYEVEDSGCSEYVIDVWRSPEDCQDFMDRIYEDGCQGKVYVQVLEAVG